MLAPFTLRTWKQRQMQDTHHRQHQSPWTPVLSPNHPEGFRHSVWTSWCALSCPPYTPQHRQLAKSAHSAHYPGATAGPRDRRVTCHRKSQENRTYPPNPHCGHDSLQRLLGMQQEEGQSSTAHTSVAWCPSLCGGAQQFWIPHTNIRCYWILREDQNAISLFWETINLKI